MLPNSLQCTRQPSPPQQRIIQPPKSERQRWETLGKTFQGWAPPTSADKRTAARGFAGVCKARRWRRRVWSSPGVGGRLLPVPGARAGAWGAAPRFVAAAGIRRVGSAGRRWTLPQASGRWSWPFPPRQRGRFGGSEAPCPRSI